MRVSVLLVLSLVVAASALARAPLGRGEDEIANEYLVSFPEGISDAEVSQHMNNLTSHPLFAIGDNQIITEWNFATFRAYHAKFESKYVLNWVLTHPAVSYVETNRVINKYACANQVGATWGLTRLTLGKGKIPGDRESDRIFPHSTLGGQGVTAYVIDTGIRISHSEFGGRASYGADFTGNKAGAEDGNGHGTHVAGTIGGKTYGVAKAVSLVAVKVLSDSGSGTNAWVISGLQYAAKNGGGKRSVANLSLGGGASTLVDDAIKALNVSGVSPIVAAGNEAADACNSSPARSPYAYSVAAADKSDLGASFTNYGTCVNIIAPGVAITSAWYTSNTDISTISGTSMASPHVAGVVAVLLSQASTVLTPVQVSQQLNSNGFISTIFLKGTTTKLYCQAPLTC